MTCKDCTHYNVCDDYEMKMPGEAICCHNFNDKSKFIELPCKVGTKLYQIVKVCGTNDGRRKEFTPSKEFCKPCENYVELGYGDGEYCHLDSNYDYCSINLTMYCDECKNRLAIEPVYFDYGMMNRVFNTPTFKKDTSLEDILFLTPEEAERALKEIENNGNG